MCVDQSHWGKQQPQMVPIGFGGVTSMAFIRGWRWTAGAAPCTQDIFQRRVMTHLGMRGCRRYLLSYLTPSCHWRESQDLVKPQRVAHLPANKKQRGFVNTLSQSEEHLHSSEDYNSAEEARNSASCARLEAKLILCNAPQTTSTPKMPSHSRDAF